MTGNPARASAAAAPEHLDAVVVGAGFAGMYMLHRLRGLGFATRVLEAGDGVGGTWYWNRYPGARCDVESMEYSYQFSDELQQQWEWTERYAAQPELLRYANHVAERFDLRRDIDFDTAVTAAHFDATSNRWRITTDTGRSLVAQFCIMATGCLSSANKPSISGLETFDGPCYHTGQWPHEPVDFTDQRVGIIGTGSSAVQSIPIIARQARHLTVFQRTPPYAVPAHNAPMPPAVQQAFKADYTNLRNRAKANRNGLLFDAPTKSAGDVSAIERDAEFERRWTRGGLTFTAAYNDILLNQASNATAADFVRGKIKAIVHDPATAALLSPATVIGCKRLCIDSGYYATYNRPNVSLVDVGTRPIEAITPAGVQVAGHVTPLDTLVLATGFDAMTGALSRIDIRGLDGLALRDKWAAGPRTYLGLASAGYPNLFTITGPGSPSVLTNMLPTIEQHVDWIADCVAYLRARGLARIDATPASEDAWVAKVNDIAADTLFPSCNSWYLGANVPGKPRVFMPYIGFPPYVETCNAVAAAGYSGFELR